MAIAFNKTKGKAQSSKVDSYEFKDGENSVRLFGGVLPRYVYWIKGTNGKDIPVECLSFDREQERFTNAETDYVPQFFPELKCSWSYSVNCIDPKDGKAKVLNLKKKLFEQIINAAADLGDPTDPDTGWNIVFKRSKTGPLPFNVSYDLMVLRCKPAPLTEEQRAVIAQEKPIDEKYPRPTPAEVLKTLEKVTAGGGDEEQDSTQDGEAVNELGG
jgi:hypothetical protein